MCDLIFPDGRMDKYVHRRTGLLKYILIKKQKTKNLKCYTRILYSVEINNPTTSSQNPSNVLKRNLLRVSNNILFIVS